MTAELAAVRPAPPVIDREQVLSILNLNPRDPNVQALLVTCERYGLDPILKHAVLIQGRLYVTRDGLLHVAHAGGRLDGIEVLQQSETKEHWIAKVAVFRKDMTHPFAYVGRYPKDGSNKKHGPEMAVKCAEVMALRRAFDVAVSSQEEMWDQGEESTSTVTAGPVVTVDVTTGEINPTPDDGTGIRDEGPQMLTDGQRRHLFALVNHLGYDEVERKARAGVDSFNDLTAARASELIDEWTALVEARAETTGGGGADGEAASSSPVDLVGGMSPTEVSETGVDGTESGVVGHSRSPQSPGLATDPPGAPVSESRPDDGKPPNQAQWDIALSHFESRPKILQAAALYLGRAVGMSTITSDELTQLTLAKLKGEV